MSTVKIPRPDLAALYLCALVVVAMTALAVAHVAIPDVLPYLATAALSAGAGLSLNSPGTVGTETIRSSSSTGRPVAASAAPAPRSASDPVAAPAAASAA